MFMLLNTATIRIIYAIVSPCKLGAIDDRIRNFTQQPFILQVMYALSKFYQAICLLWKDERSSQLCYRYASGKVFPSFFSKTVSLFFQRVHALFFLTRRITIQKQRGWRITNKSLVRIKHLGKWKFSTLLQILHAVWHGVMHKNVSFETCWSRLIYTKVSSHRSFVINMHVVTMA